jgi:hypothetical protein
MLAQQHKWRGGGNFWDVTQRSGTYLPKLHGTTSQETTIFIVTAIYTKPHNKRNCQPETILNISLKMNFIL